MSVFSEGFFKGTLGSDGLTPGKNGVQINTHTIFLHSKLLPATEKLQRETKGRKTKELHTELQSAVLGLRSFMMEEWPPKKNANDDAATVDTANVTESSDETLKAAASSEEKSVESDVQSVEHDADVVDDQKDDNNHAENGDVDEGPKPENDDGSRKDAVEEAERDAKEAGSRDNKESIKSDVEEADADENNEVAAAEEEEVKPAATKKPVSAPRPVPENSDGVVRDDPQTRETMHSSVFGMIQVVRKILHHPSRTPRAVELCLDIINLLVTYRYVSGRAGGRDDTSGSGNAVASVTTPTNAETTTDDDEKGEEAQQKKKKPSLLHALLQSVTSCSEQNVDAVQVALIKCLTSFMTSPKCGVHEASMLLCLKSTFHVYLVTKSLTAKDMSKAALLDMMRSVFSRMEAYDVINKEQQQQQQESGVVAETPEGSEGDGEDYKPPPFPSQYHTDSYVLFRALCKMSSKELPADNNETEPAPRLFAANSQGTTDPLALNNKILSLDLILSSMDYLGEAFREARFLHLVQHYLCVSLLQNCMSHQTEVAYLSQKIFLVLVYKFKGHLKQEIEVFLSNIFLRVLDSPNSSFKQKAIVLESLRSLCRDPVLLTQIFLNYDCDFDAMNLYKDIVQALTKLGGKASANPSTNKKEADEDLQLSLAGLEALITILKAFLRALNLPGCDDVSDDIAGNALRSMLQLNAALTKSRPNPHPNVSGRASMDSSVVSGPDDAAAVDRETNEGTAAGKIVDAFEQKRNAEQNFEIGAVKFALSAKSGVRFFFDCGLMERNARSVASFFLANKEKLDKTQMGEVLGREPDAAFIKEKGVDAEDGGPGFFVRVLHHYADLLDFKGLAFDGAIRLFLAGFRLPGEAQKIDRIMEKFAEKFTSQNPTVFPSPDTAFILAFSVIMLNTDLHNPSIKPERRMTVDSFLRNNRGIGENGGDLDTEFLTGIFNRIKEAPFSLKEDDEAREKVNSGARPMFDSSAFFEGSALFKVNPEERKRELFKAEKEEMMNATQKLARHRPAPGKPDNTTDSIPPSEVIKPMFDVTWGPLMGAFSQVLECSDDEPCIAACLNGIVYCIRIASNSRMSLVRDTFVSTLTKFTFLGSPKEMKPKNVESIRTLLGIAINDGEYLENSWGTVLQCISQLARLRLTASGLDSDESFLVEKQGKVDAESKPNAKQVTKEEQAREIQANNGRAVLESIPEVLIDKVFSSSVNVSATNLGIFIAELVAISKSEIAGTSKQGLNSTGSEDASKSGLKVKGSEGPAIFSLQRLVEVADCNMNVRPRLVWAQVWEMMASYFTQIACNQNVRVSAFAIDSLRQLSFKFLEKPELSEFNFQRLFLNPFLVVMEDPSSTEDVRELVLRCIDNMIRTKAGNLRSGWKVIFSILIKSASDVSQKIEYLGIAILQRLLDDHLDELFAVPASGKEAIESEELSPIDRRVRNSNVDDFNDLCKASLAFVQVEESESPRSAGLSMRAFCHIAIYADLLAAGRVLPPVEGALLQSRDKSQPGYTYDGLDGTEALDMVLWRPMIEGLADGIRSTVKSMAGGVGCIIQRGSGLALRAILLRHGHSFSPNQLCAILEQSLLPAIQDGVVSDKGPVNSITSESPSMSSIDFLVNALPIPPPPDDISLLRFEAMNAAPNRRSLGKAELMLEASFSDLRHNGDGDLRKAFILAKKAAAVAPKPIEQPFPNSWLATTSPLALGLLTDITSELVTKFDSKDRETALSLIFAQYKLWCLGSSSAEQWQPCEAIVRVACREIERLAERLASKIKEPGAEDARAWSSSVFCLISDVIVATVGLQEKARSNLVDSKEEALEARRGKFRANEDASLDGTEDTPIDTQFGKGRLKSTRKDKYRGRDLGTNSDLLFDTNVVRLQHGAVLYSPVKETIRKVIPLDEASDPTSSTKLVNGIPREVSVPAAYWEELVPFLKIRIVAVHCLQKSVVILVRKYVDWLDLESMSGLLDTLGQSRSAAQDAGKNEDIATAFQEALLHEWGDGVAEVEMALDSAARLSHLHGSSMFFLTQEGSATHASLNILSLLYVKREGSIFKHADSEPFAEPRIVQLLDDVISKFLKSEKRDGHLVDPSIWRNLNEGGGKIALYCTFFAPVVVDMLQLINEMSVEQFSRRRKELFGIVCSLVSARSDEIRDLVQQILERHVAPLI